MKSKISTLVINVIENVRKENGVKTEIEINENTNLLTDIGLDSLGLAAILVQLESKTGKDPFKKGFVRFSTLQELIKLYEN